MSFEAQSAIPRHERHVVDEARRGDQFVGGIASDVEPCARANNFPRQRPDMDPRQDPDDVRIIEIHVDPSQLSQFRDFPEHDRGHAPAIGAEHPCLARLQRSGNRVQQHVGVNVQHPTWLPPRECSLDPELALERSNQAGGVRSDRNELRHRLPRFVITIPAASTSSSSDRHCSLNLAAAAA